jgi:hypothetical protein
VPVTNSLSAPSLAYAWLRLKRVGNEFTGLVSAEGKTWKT